jgi:predicted permease
MAYFTSIIYNNIIPLAIMIALGITLYRIFKLDLRTLSKLNMYFFSPVVVFKMLYESAISYSVLFMVLGFWVVQWVALAGVAEVVIRIRGTQGQLRAAMRNSVLFYNSANYALPLNQLVFVGDPFTLSVQSIIMVMMNLMPNTYGIYSVNAHKSDWKEIMRTIAKMPTIYAIPLGFLMHGLQIPIPAPLYTPINYISNAFMATALLTLGVQLGAMKWSIKFSDVLLVNMLRLCVAPAIGFSVVFLLGFEGDLAKALILSCAVPTSLASALLAVEFDNEPEFASQAVFSSTIFSVFTVTFVIYLLQFVP